MESNAYQKLIELNKPVDILFTQLIDKIDDLKPKDRSQRDKHYAVLLTELSKAYAYFNTYILNNQ